MDLRDKKAWLRRYGIITVASITQVHMKGIVVEYKITHGHQHWSKAGYSLDTVAGLIFNDVKEALFNVCESRS